MRRLFFIAGLAVGYVLGTKAGRQRYEQLASVADKLWGSSVVQRNVGRAEGYVKAKAPKVVDLAKDGARTVVHAASAPKRRTKSGSAASGGSKAESAPESSSGDAE